MTTATNILKAALATAEGQTVPAPADPQLFASLLPATAGEGEADAKADDAENPGADAAAPKSEEDEGPIDASVLLPMLDMQRSATPAAVAVKVAAEKSLDPAAPPQSGGASPTLVASAAAVSEPADAGAEAEPGARDVRGAPSNGAEPAPRGAAAQGPEPKPAEIAQQPAAKAAVIQTKAEAGIVTEAVAAAASQAAELPASAGEARAQRTKAGDARALGAVQASGSEGEAPSSGSSALPAAAATPTTPAAQPAMHAVPPVLLSNGIESASPQRAPAPASSPMLDFGGGDEWINELARDIARVASPDGTMRFRLSPETLGEMKVEITQSERGSHVRMNVTTEAAQQALAEAQPKLVAEARAQGVRIAETEISFTGGHSSGREAGGHAAHQSEQPMRALRGGPDTDTDSTDAPRRTRSERYA
jgi:flagellar hook-length control protein FliK